MTKLRDTQRSKLYKAEREALEPLMTPVKTVQDVEKYVKKVMSRAAIVSRYGRELRRGGVEVKDGRGCRRALGSAWEITIPRWARQDWVVLHELSHSIIGRRYYQGGIAAHGWQFAAVYIDLVHFMMGKAAADALKASFRKHRVRWRPKQKRVATPEQIARLAAARAAKRTLTEPAEAA